MTVEAATGPVEAEVTRRRRARRSTLVPLVLFALLALVPPLAALGPEGYVLSFATRLVILAIAAVSLDLLIGYGGLVSFGHAAFLGIGAYATGILLTEGVEDLVVVLPVALGASALFALLTGAVCLRTSGVSFIMITLAFGQMLFFTLSSLSVYGGDDGLTLWSGATLLGSGLLDGDRALYYAALLALLGAYLVCRAAVASRFGRVLRAARENPTRATAVGFDVLRYRLGAYVLAGMIAGLAGCLLALQAEFVSPAIASWQRSGELIFMVVLGGAGSLHGAVLGAGVFLLLEELLAEITRHWKLIFGPLLVLVVLFARGGLMGLFGLSGGGRG